jgi:hypothetical protein
LLYGSYKGFIIGPISIIPLILVSGVGVSEFDFKLPLNAAAEGDFLPFEWLAALRHAITGIQAFEADAIHLRNVIHGLIALYGVVIVLTPPTFALGLKEDVVAVREGGLAFWEFVVTGDALGTDPEPL